jgi:hypothetical protein
MGIKIHQIAKEIDVIYVKLSECCPMFFLYIPIIKNIVPVKNNATSILVLDSLLFNFLYKFLHMVFNLFFILLFIKEKGVLFL